MVGVGVDEADSSGASHLVRVLLLEVGQDTDALLLALPPSFLLPILHSHRLRSLSSRSH